MPHPSAWFRLSARMDTKLVRSSKNEVGVTLVSRGEWCIEASCCYTFHSNGNVTLSQNPNSSCQVLQNSNISWYTSALRWKTVQRTHSEKLQLTTSPKPPFPQQNTPWVPNIDVTPGRLEEAFGAAFHAHVDGLEPLSVPMMKKSLKGRKNHHLQPLQQTQQKAHTHTTDPANPD